MKVKVKVNVLDGNGACVELSFCDEYIINIILCVFKLLTIMF